MAIYAYKDPQRRDVIYASDAISKNRETRYYCPNPSCDAKLYVCAVDGSHRAYFRATKQQYGHTNGCPYASPNGCSPDDFNEAAFDFSDAMDRLMQETLNRGKKEATATDDIEKSDSPKKDSSEKKPPKTLRQIYFLCKSVPEKDTYASCEIGSMLLDERSIYRYPKGCYGKRIVEATASRRFYDNDAKKIFLRAPVNNYTYTFTLEFEGESIYRLIRDEIYNNREKLLVVAGDWKSDNAFNHFSSKITSRKQFVVIK